MAVVELEKEYKFYLKNQSEWVSKYQGKYLVVRDHELVGVFDTDIEAYRNASSKYPPGTFLIQKCEPGKQTQVYHSRCHFIEAKP